MKKENLSEINYFVVKWGGLWLACFGWMRGDEDLTHSKDNARKFESKTSAQKYIDRIIKNRGCKPSEFKIIPAKTQLILNN